MKDLMVPRRQQKPRPTEFRSGGDQGHEVPVAPGHTVAEEAHERGVSCYATEMLHHGCCPLVDGILEFAASIETMDVATQRVARVDVTGLCLANIIAGEAMLEWRPLHGGKRFAGPEPQRRDRHSERL